MFHFYAPRKGKKTSGFLILSGGLEMKHRREKKGLMRKIQTCKIICFSSSFPLCVPVYICGALRDLVPFVQFQKRQKRPLRNVIFNKVTGFSLQLDYR